MSKLKQAQAERDQLAVVFWQTACGSTAEKAITYAYNRVHRRCRRLGERTKYPRYIPTNTDKAGEMTMSEVMSPEMVEIQRKAHNA